MKETSDVKGKKTETSVEDTPDKQKDVTFGGLLLEALTVLWAGGGTSDGRNVVRLMRKFTRLRHSCNVATLLEFVNMYFGYPECGDHYTVLREMLERALNFLIDDAKTKEDAVMIAAACSDDAAPKDKENNEGRIDSLMTKGSNFDKCHPNFDVLLGTLVLVKAIDEKWYKLATEIASNLVAFVKQCPRRSVDDLISAKVYFYYSRAFELNGDFYHLRSELMTAYREAVLHHAPTKQAVTLNCLLRNYLHYGDTDLAIKLVSKAGMPENLRSNSQTCRYLFYLGRLQAAQLDYSEAHSSLMEAVGKTPQTPIPGVNDLEERPLGKSTADGTKDQPIVRSIPSKDLFDMQAKKRTVKTRAQGFRLTCYKYAIVVELLMGGIPRREVFNQYDLKEGLKPYKEIVNAVRSGDLTAFQKASEVYQPLFASDGTEFLMRRLHRSVLLAGLCKINLAYSQISLECIAQKLGLDSAEEAEGVLSKAIADGVIDAIIDHDEMCFKSKPVTSIYSCTTEPAAAFQKRVTFCLQLHNDAIEAMQYPEDNRKSEEKTTEAENRRKEMNEQLMRAEESSDDDVDMM